MLKELDNLNKVLIERRKRRSDRNNIHRRTMVVKKDDKRENEFTSPDPQPYPTTVTSDDTQQYFSNYGQTMFGSGHKK